MVSEQVFTRRDFVAFGVLTAVNLGACSFAVFYWFSHADPGDDFVAFVLLTLPLWLGVAMFQSKWLALPLMRRPAKVPAAPGLRVGVATTFVPGSESR